MYVVYVCTYFHTSTSLCQCWLTSVLCNRYASSWFLTLFSTTLQQPLACRVMDCFLVDGVEVIFRIALACLTLGKEELFSMDMEGMLKVGWQCSSVV